VLVALDILDEIGIHTMYLGLAPRGGGKDLVLLLIVLIDVYTS
jgi:hypothetical protein